MVRIGGASIILLAVFLDAKNKALDFEVFFLISLSSHQSEKLSRSAFIKVVITGRWTLEVCSVPSSANKSKRQYLIWQWLGIRYRIFSLWARDMVPYP